MTIRADVISASTGVRRPADPATHGARIISGMCTPSSKLVILAHVSCSPNCQPSEAATSAFGKKTQSELLSLRSPKVTTAVDSVSLSSSSLSSSFPMLKSCVQRGALVQREFQQTSCGRELTVYDTAA